MVRHQMVQLFFTDYGGYVLEILLSTGLFCIRFERKPHFWLRVMLVACIISLFVTLYGTGVSLLPGVLYHPAVANIIRYILVYGFIFVGILYAFDTQYSNAMFSLVCGTATQHMSFRLYSCILVLLDQGYDAPYAWVPILLTSAIVYTTVYLTLGRRINQNQEHYFNNRLTLVTGGMVALLTVILHFLMEPYVNLDSEPMIFILVSFHSILCCAMALMIEHGLFRNRVLANDKELLEHLIYQQKEQFRISKDNIDMINIKCHDMKHQISQLTGAVNQEVVQELEHIINIYDANLKTGNEILDVCLMEKKLQCEKNHIKFDCIANGACLDFMVPSDIFALFGNALENAIEASCNISNEARRIISLNVTTQLGMVIIHIENNYEGQLVFNDGLPSTTKDDHNYHGFGVRSIQMIAEKYKGNVAVLADEGIFNLNISLPMQ